MIIFIICCNTYAVSTRAFIYICLLGSHNRKWEYFIFMLICSRSQGKYRSCFHFCFTDKCMSCLLGQCYEKCNYFHYLLLNLMSQGQYRSCQWHLGHWKIANVIGPLSCDSKNDSIYLVYLVGLKKNMIIFIICCNTYTTYTVSTRAFI